MSFSWKFKLAWGTAAACWALDTADSDGACPTDRHLLSQCWLTLYLRVGETYLQCWLTAPWPIFGEGPSSTESLKSRVRLAVAKFEFPTNEMKWSAGTSCSTWAWASFYVLNVWWSIYSAHIGVTCIIFFPLSSATYHSSTQIPVFTWCSTTAGRYWDCSSPLKCSQQLCLIHISHYSCLIWNNIVPGNSFFSSMKHWTSYFKTSVSNWKFHSEGKIFTHPSLPVIKPSGQVAFSVTSPLWTRN